MNNKKYESIINLEHHVSLKHPQMSMRNRAAQFSPFAALTGFENKLEQAKETAVKNILNSERNEKIWEAP
ncbi:MAG: hypothetical protein K6E98_06660 [Lachnospiraceae bacterium]|nr:hypothetical protein [Lachnospiraceae bacterium]